MDGSAHPLAGVRYARAESIGGTGAVLLTQAGRLYGVHYVAYTGPGVATLYDHSRFPQNPIVTLAGTAGAPDDFPQQRVHPGFGTGLYVSFAVGTAAAVTVLWERR